MKRKALAWILILCMIFSSMPMSVFATSAEAETSTVVAKIGDTGYETLQDAINEAKDGDTITVLTDIISDINSDNTVSLNDKYETVYKVAGKGITIDLKGNKIIGNVNAARTTMLVGLFSTEDNGHLTLNDSSNGEAVVEIKSNGTNVYGLLVNFDGTSTMTVNDGNYCLDAASDSLIYSGSDETVTVNGGNFYLGNVGTGSNESPWIFNASGQNTANIIVNGGTYNADIVHQYYPFEVAMPKELALKNNGNGTWSVVDAVAYVTEQEWSSAWYTNEVGYATMEEAKAAAEKNIDEVLTGGKDTEEGRNAAAGKVKVYSLTPVASVNGVNYSSLQEAINAAEDGATITVLTDINLSETELNVLDNTYDTYFKVEGKNVTIDLNGKKISGEYPTPKKEMLVGVFSTDNNGHLTLTGNGTVDVTATGKVYSLFANYEGGCSITIENGTYKLDEASDSLAYTGTNEGIIVNGGTFTLGNVGTGKNDSPWIFNAKGQNTAHVIVTGGTYNADINHQFYPFEVDVPREKALKDNDNGTWTVVDAVAYVTEQEWSSKWYTHEVGYADVEEAEVKAATNKEYVLNSRKNGDTDENRNVAAAKIKVYKAVASVNGKTYFNLKEAIAAANAIEGGATVELLKDVTLGEKLTISGDVTITGEHIITRDDAYTGTLFAVAEDATLNIENVSIDSGAEWTVNQVKIDEEKEAGKSTEIFKSGMTAEEQKAAAFGYINLSEKATVATERMISVKGNLILSGVTVKNFVGETAGVGIILVDGGNVEVKANTVFTNNFAWRAGGDDHGGIVRIDSGNAKFEKGSKINNNVVIGANGSLIGIVDGTVDMSCDVKDNVAVNSNGLIQGSGYNGTVPKIIVNGGTLSDNVIIPGVNNGFASVIYNRNGEFTMNAGEITNNIGGSWPAFNMRYATVSNFNGGTVSGNTSMSGSEYTMHLRGGASVAESMTITGDVDVYGGSEPVTNAGTIDGDVCVRFNGTFENNGTVTGKVNISEGFNVTLKGNGSYGEVTVLEDATLTIYAGTFDDDVSQYVAKGYKAFDNGNGSWTVKENQIFKLNLTDPATGEPATVPYIIGNDINDVVEKGKLFYANYYEMTLEILDNAEIDEPVVIDYPMTIDLGGNAITGNNVYPVFRIQGGADVTVKNGTVTNDDYVFVLGASDGSSAGNLTIESGKYHGVTTVASVTKGTLTVNGGEFSADPYEGSYTYLLNCIDANYKDGSAKIEVKGGRFHGFNPENNAAEGSATDFVPVGYRSSIYDTIDGKDVYDVVELKATVEAGGITYYYPGVENVDSVQELTNYYFLMQNAMGWIFGYDYTPELTIFADVEDETVLGNTPSDDTTVTLPDTVTWTIKTNGFDTSNIKAAENYTKVENADGTYTVKPELVVTFDDITMALGNKLPEFTWTSNFTGVTELVVEKPEVTVNGVGEYVITADAYVLGSDKYVVKVVPGKLTVVEAVAEINGVGYGSLQTAIDAAQDGDTVKMLKDINFDGNDVVETEDGRQVKIKVDKDITLDMNGKTITVDDTVATKMTFAVVLVEDGANLTVTGNGAIDVKGVQTVIHDEINRRSTCYMFWKRGTTGSLTIENGRYHAEDLEDSMVYTNGNEIVTVNGGTFILDTTGDGPDGNGSPWIFNVQGQNTAHVMVYGGTYNAEINHQHYPFEVEIPNTHVVRNNNDGTWTVVPEAAVASVNEQEKSGNWYTHEVGYATIEEAIAAAKAQIGNGDDDYVPTVTVLKDCVDSQMATVVPAGVTLDLNGHTLTAEYVASFGQVMDSTDGTGKLVVGKENVYLRADNSQLPLYDADGYRFFKFIFENVGSKYDALTSPNMVKFGSRLSFTNKAAYELLKNEDNGIELGIAIRWDAGKDGESNIIELPRVYSKEAIDEYATTIVNKPKSAFTMTVKGLSNLADGTVLTSKTYVKTISGVYVLQTHDFTYTVN